MDKEDYRTALFTSLWTTRTLNYLRSQYVVPTGVSYNSYVIMDDKICDSWIQQRMQEFTDQWFANLREALGDMESRLISLFPIWSRNHASNIQEWLREQRHILICRFVGNAKTCNMMGPFFFDIDINGQKGCSGQREISLSLGKHEAYIRHGSYGFTGRKVMMEYESTRQGAFLGRRLWCKGLVRSDTDEDWTCEARRYYFNIVGKYGAQVQAVLKKAAGLDIEKICPLHGPILTENLGFYIDKYNTWSSYQPEDEGILVACASIHGNTKKAAELLAEKLKATGVKVAFTDLCRDDMAEAVEDAFRYDRLVLCACTYDGGIFPPMEDFLHHLKAKAYQNRKIAFVENGSWAPTAARQMKAIVEGFKNIECVEPVVTIKSTLNEASEKQMDELVAALTK